MRKYRKHAKIKRSKKQIPNVVLYSLILFMLAATVWYNHSRPRVLGLETGSGEIPGKTEPQPTQAIIPISIVPSIAPTMQPTVALVTAIPIEPTQTVQNPIPTPTFIVPDEPVYVPGVGIPGGTPTTEIDIGGKTVTVVVENTPGGVTTTTQELTPKTEVVTTTVITAQTGQSTANTSTTTASVDRLLAFFSRSEPVSNDITKPDGIAYQQVYTSDINSRVQETDATETISALNQWLGFNNIKLASLGDGSFSITQGDIVAIVTPTDGKIAVNLSRMEFLINTPTDFKALSYLPKRVADYVMDLNVISDVRAPIQVINTPSEVIYKLKGRSEQYLFAVVPVPINIDFCMSATTMNPCGREQSLFSKALDLLSI